MEHKHKGLPQLRRNLQGDVVLEIQCPRGCRHSLCIEFIGCIYENLGDVENGQQATVQFSGGLIPTIHSYTELMDLLYPSEDNYESD